MTHIAYVDGACSGNPGPGGFGIYIKHADGSELEISGHEPAATNNRMELMAAIVCIERLPNGHAVEIFTDSQYVKQGITLWIHAWKRKNWITSDGEPVKNKDLWQRLEAATLDHGAVRWNWVKGHSGHSGNDRADRLAAAASKGRVVDGPPEPAPEPACKAAPLSFQYPSRGLSVYPFCGNAIAWSALWSLETVASLASAAKIVEPSEFRVLTQLALDAARDSGWQCNGDPMGQVQALYTPVRGKGARPWVFVIGQPSDDTVYLVSSTRLKHLES